MLSAIFKDFLKVHEYETYADVLPIRHIINFNVILQ